MQFARFANRAGIRPVASRLLHSALGGVSGSGSAAAGRNELRLLLQPVAPFSTDAPAADADTDAASPVPTVTITFVEEDLEDGERITVQAPLGAKLVDVALDADVDIEAACGGELACSTCHCVFTDKSLFDALPPKQEEVRALSPASLPLSLSLSLFLSLHTQRPTNLPIPIQQNR